MRHLFFHFKHGAVWDLRNDDYVLKSILDLNMDNMYTVCEYLALGFSKHGGVPNKTGISLNMFF